MHQKILEIVKNAVKIAFNLNMLFKNDTYFFRNLFYY